MLGGKKALILENYVGSSSADIKKNFYSVIELMKSKNSTISTSQFIYANEIRKEIGKFIRFTMAINFQKNLKTAGVSWDKILERRIFTDSFLENGKAWTPLINKEVRSKLDALEKYSEKYINIFTNIFSDTDVFLFPTTVLGAAKIEDIKLSNKHTLVYNYIQNTSLANYLDLPAISIPSGVDSLGMPIGFHLMSLPGKESILLEVAHALEKEIQFVEKPNLANANFN